MRLFLVALTLAAAACGSPPVQQIVIGPPPPAETRAVLAGPLCGANGACKCRDENAAGDAGAGIPDGTRKRFEFRLGPTDNDLWATVDGQVLYKSKERPTDCFYLDLPSGRHQVTLRSHRPSGTQIGLRIQELGVAAKSWYRTFDFACGIPGTCSHDELDGKKAELHQYKGGIHDPCGSVRIKNVSWDTGVAPDQIHPQDVAVGLTLDIYKFRPGKPSGDPTCGTGPSAAEDGPAPADDAPAPDAPDAPDATTP